MLLVLLLIKVKYVTSDFFKNILQNDRVAWIYNVFIGKTWLTVKVEFMEIWLY